MKDPIIIASLITLVGVIVSISITLFINYRSRQLGEKEMYKAIERDYALELLKKRLECYPILNFELSSMHKQIHLNNKLVRSEILDFFNKTNELNSKYSVFFSTETVSEYYSLWIYLIELLNRTKENEQISKSDGLEKVRLLMQGVEIAFKKDIGVFIVDFQDGKRLKNIQRSYQKIESNLKKEKHMLTKNKRH